jgi:hypothetical protein
VTSCRLEHPPWNSALQRSRWSRPIPIHACVRPSIKEATLLRYAGGRPRTPLVHRCGGWRVGVERAAAQMTAGAGGICRRLAARAVSRQVLITSTLSLMPSKKNSLMLQIKHADVTPYFNCLPRPTSRSRPRFIEHKITNFLRPRSVTADRYLSLNRSMPGSSVSKGFTHSWSCCNPLLFPFQHQRNYVLLEQE